MNLELAFHDIEAFRAGMQEVRASIQEVRASIQEVRSGIQELGAVADRHNESIRELRMLSENQHENMGSLMKMTGDLVALVNNHEGRIRAIEGRI